MILASGCFDGLHAGHVRYLQAVKDATDQKVVVAVAPDAYIRETKHREPYWTQDERCYVVSRLPMVCDVLPQIQASVATLISTYAVTVFAKGMDWRDRLPEDVLEACRRKRVALLFVDTPGKHTSEAIK